MDRRLLLQALLEQILGSDHVYFQPPPNVQMEYRCIVYKLDDAITRFADNTPYTFHKRYQLTIIDRDPDTDILAKVAALPMCTFDRSYAARNLNHYIFNLYF